ncbi:MAG TPA: dienelactone hydrolase family protein, partial [Ramlibacter sp.]|uniref:dienelactone hydrolase family protein n=1 Tax=Ramlibacter sp. TaxID=1917967 RepID=UPI002D7E839C
MLKEQVHVGPGSLPGELLMPEGATGLVLFAHGSGSSRLSPRNVFVARALHARALGTLLFDLLTEHEAHYRANVFEIALLGERLQEAIAWVRARADVGALPLGLFGASTGAAGALLAAAQRPDDVAAVVSRGGRPDLALTSLPQVRAPTLLIVGGADTEVLGLNRVAFAHLGCEKRLEVVPGATHLFEEPGTLEQVAELAG